MICMRIVGIAPVMHVRHRCRGVFGGAEMAREANSWFVHRYRLKPYGSATDALGDTQRAMHEVRAHAKEWKIDPAKIGHIGFAAGGEKTARLALTFDAGDPDAGDPCNRIRSRPDWIVLVHPGWVPGTLNMEKVPKNLPPTFLVCAGTGDVEMQLYGEGKHAGASSPRQGIPFGTWHLRRAEWADELKLFPASK